MTQQGIDVNLMNLSPGRALVCTDTDALLVLLVDFTILHLLLTHTTLLFSSIFTITTNTFCGIQPDRMSRFR